MEFLAQLQNPPRVFTAIPFWFLNGDLTDAELRRQLADFTAHGIYGAILHPRMGLSPDITYLGRTLLCPYPHGCRSRRRAGYENRFV